ncbi:MAG: hypothetical protein P1P65_03015 [Treponema sp.]
MGVSTAIKNQEFTKSFTEWSISTGSNGFSYALKRFALSDSELRKITLNVITDEEVKEQVQQYAEWAQSRAERFIPLTDDLSTWLKENLPGGLPSGSMTNLSITIKDESGNIKKRTAFRQLKQMLTGTLAVTVADDGSVTEITDLTGVGLYKKFFIE